MCQGYRNVSATLPSPWKPPQTAACGNLKHSPPDFGMLFVSWLLFLYILLPLTFTKPSPTGSKKRSETWRPSTKFLRRNRMERKLTKYKSKNANDFPKNSQCHRSQSVPLRGASVTFPDQTPASPPLPASFHPAILFPLLDFPFLLLPWRRKTSKRFYPLSTPKDLPFSIAILPLLTAEFRISPTSIGAIISYR